MYITGNIAVYFVSYLHKYNPTLTVEDINIIMPLQVLCQNSTMYLSSRLCLKYGSHVYFLDSPIILGTFLIVLGVFSSSFCRDFYSLIVCYGVLFGLGNGFSVTLTQYSATLVVAWKNFPLHKSRATGMIVTGFGLGASVFNVVATALVNPNNAHPTIQVKNGSVTNHLFDDPIASSLPSMLRWLALIYFVMSFTGFLLTLLSSSPPSPRNSDSLPVKPHLKSKRFWLLAFTCYCSVATGLYIAAAYKGLGDQSIHDDEFLAITGSVASVCNGSFRILWAQVMEWTSFRTTYMVLLILQITLVSTLYYVSTMKWLFLIWVTFILICMGGHLTLFPALHSVLYGTELGAKVLGFFFYALGVSAVTGFFIQLFVIAAVGYQAMCWVLACLSAVSFIIMLKFNPEAQAKNPNNDLALSTQKPQYTQDRLLDI